MWQVRVVPPRCSLCLNLPLTHPHGPPWLYLPQKCSCSFLLSVLHIVHIIQKLQVAVGDLKRGVCMLAEQGEATGMGPSLQMSMELQKITWDNLLQAPPTSKKKGQTSLYRLEWHFLKSLVLCPCWSQWKWPIWEQVSVPQNISP